MSLFTTTAPSPSCQPAPTGSDSSPAVRPAYDVKETADAYALTVRLPGVAKDGLEITAEGGELRIAGRRNWKQPEGWTTLHRETSDVSFKLVLEHDARIDVEKIHADLKEGILSVSLPKAETLKPRKIAVN